jgi:hypothetical protein
MWELLRQCLAALNEMFEDDHVKVDLATFNPSQIWKLYGTIARKGDNTQARPWRSSKLPYIPDKQTIVERDYLAALANTLEPSARKNNVASARRYGGVDIDDFMFRHFPDSRGPMPWVDGGRKWVLRICPFNPDHKRGEACVVELASGAISASCRHESCEWGWAELRVLCAGDPKAKPRAEAPRRDRQRLEWIGPGNENINGRRGRKLDGKAPP